MKKSSKATYSVYVVELSKDVFNEDRRFRNANIQYMGMLECLYVGMTSLSPEERFKKHKTGARSMKGFKISSKYVEKFGLYLRPGLYRDLNPLTKAEAVKMEEELALDLRRKGYAVWWN